MAEPDLNAINTLMGQQQQPQQLAAQQAPQQPRADQGAISNLMGDSGGNQKGKIRTDGLTLMEEFVVGLNKLQPEKQAEFLQEQGYATSIQNGQVKVDRGQGPEDFNPDGFDSGDVARWFPEVLVGGLEAIGTGAKVAGLVAGPATLGASVAAGAAVGGLAGGAGELALQTGARIAGVRDEFDFGEIGKAAGLGAAIPVGGAVAGKALKGVGKVAGEAIGRGKEAIGEAVDTGLSRITGRPAPGKPAPPPAPPSRVEVRDASRRLGIEPTEAQLSDSPLTQFAESRLFARKGTVGGIGVRKEADEIARVADARAQEIVRGKTDRSPADIGADVVDKIQASVRKKIGKAESLYGKIQSSMDEIPASVDKIEAGLDKIAHDFRKSKKTLNFINQMREEIATSKTVDDLVATRRALFDEVGPDAVGGVSAARDRIYGLLTKARSDSYDAAIAAKEAVTEGAGAEFAAAKKMLAEADAIYAKTAKEVERGVLRGANIKGGVEKAVKKKFKDADLDKIVTNLQTGTSSTRAKALRDLSPEAFGAAKEEIINRMVIKATPKAQGTFGEVMNPAVLAREMQKMIKQTPELAEMVFGKDGVQKANDLVTVFRSLPKNFNPSGTAAALDNPLSLLKQADSISLALLRKRIRTFMQAGHGAAQVAVPAGKFSREDNNAAD